MSKLVGLVFSLVVLVGISSCSNEFDLVTGEVNIPIVYGLLDAQDTAHYIRVEKAFVDPNIPATQLALDPNQLYYDNAVVRLINNVTDETFTLTRVDGNLEGYQRQEGAFATAPNYLYKISNKVIKLNQKINYRIEVEIPGEETVTSSTFIVEKPSSSTPNSSAPNGTAISFPLDKNVNISWSRVTGGFLATGVFIIKYREEIEGVSTDKSLVWNLFNNVEGNTYPVKGAEFYSFLAANIPVVAGAKRYFSGIDYTLVSGGVEIQDYLKVAQANLGITSSGEIPNYSNLSRGRGIFSSRSHLEVLDIQLKGDTQDDLRDNPVTAPLNFQ